MNDSDLEAIIDRRVIARLATDRDYLNAENSEQQAWAERKIEMQEEIAVLSSRALPTVAETNRLQSLREQLWQHMQALEPASAVCAGAARPRTLVVTYDITGLPNHEVDALCGEAEAQAEHSSDYTEDEPDTGHRDVRVKSEIIEGTWGA